jgi:preprotein translocase subunit SecA
LRDQVTSVLSHIELRFEAPPMPMDEMFANGPGGGPGGPPPTDGHYAELREPAMAGDERVMLGAGDSPAPPPASRRGNGRADRSAPRGGGQAAEGRAPWAGTPRNATCPCGSGKKFKHCHGRI